MNTYLSIITDHLLQSRGMVLFIETGILLFISEIAQQADLTLVYRCGLDE